MKHASITLNSTKANNMVASFVRCEAIWLHKLIVELTCNVLDLASLGNAANVCVGSKFYNI
jgi:hypothetical protein